MTPFYSSSDVRIFHGDATHVLRELADAGERLDMLATDPPYSSGGTFRGDRTADPNAKYVTSGTIADRPGFGGDTRDQRSYLQWCWLWLEASWQLAAPGAVCAVFSDWRQLPVITDAVQAAGWCWRGIFAWDKTEGSRPRMGGFRAQCEFVAWGSAGPMRESGHAGPGVWKGSACSGDRLHLAEKPVPLMVELLRVVPAGGLVVDPFAGSGSTLVAARQLGLRAVGIEADERHCETAARRLAQRSIDWPTPQ